MILAKNEQGELCLIGNDLTWYSSYEPIKVLKDLPIQLKRQKCSDTLKDMIAKQIELRNKASIELELRHKLIDILTELEEKYTENKTE